MARPSRKSLAAGDAKAKGSTAEAKDKSRKSMTAKTATLKRKRQSLHPEPAPKRAHAEAEAFAAPQFTAAGKIFVLGTGDCGQLGLGEDVTEKSRPGVVTIENEQVVQVTAGGMHTACLCASGNIFTWGVNDEGALGRYTEGDAWKSSGLAKGEPGDSYTPAKVEMPAGSARVVQLSAGDSHTAALTTTGEVYVWGTFRDSGGVMGFSANKKIQVVPERVWAPTHDAERCVSISSGTDHVAALTNAHTVLTWGSGQQGQLGRMGPRQSDRVHGKLETLLTPAPLHMPFLRGDRPAAVSCGHYATFVVTQRGRVYACGLNNYGQLGFGGDTLSFLPRLVKSLSARTVKQVAGGEHHSLALDADDGIVAFGRPTYGRLGCEGVATESDDAVPEPKAVAVADLPEGDAVVALAAGGAVSGCVSSSMCGLWLWGFGTNGQLGKGDEDDGDEHAPAKVKRTKTFNEVAVTQLAFGGQHAVMLGVPTQ